MPGETNANLILERIQTNQIGKYMATVTDAEGSVATPIRTVTIGPSFAKLAIDSSLAAAAGQSIVWGDMNNDGWSDVFCPQRSSAKTTLYTNDQRGGFSRAAGTAGVNLANPLGGAWGDFDNDGALDLFISVNNNGNDVLLQNKGDGTFSPITKGPIVSSAGNGNGCAWADYDRDGFVDMYVANSDGSNFLFHNNGDGTFKRISAGAMVAGTANSQGCAWIDYDADGFPDLFVTRSQSMNLLLHNNGDGTFTKITNEPMAKDGGSGLGFCWGDFDNDGLPDLFVANGGDNYLYHNSGMGHFTKVTSPIGKDAGAFQTVNWIDYDNDGWLDLFLATVQAGSTCKLFHNNGDGSFTRVADAPLLTKTARWFAAGWADMNNDGFPDVFVSIINSGGEMHQNNGNDNNWITVKCLGRVSNRSAIGAKVRVLATIFGRTFWQVREISAGGNVGSQDQLDPMFGLGDATQIGTLRVEWPSGLTQEFHGVAARQIFTLKEPSKLEQAFSGGSQQFSWMLRGGKNVAYVIEQSTNLQTWTAWVSLTNITGQMTFKDDANSPFRAYRAVEP